MKTCPQCSAPLEGPGAANNGSCAACGAKIAPETKPMSQPLRLALALAPAIALLGLPISSQILGGDIFQVLTLVALVSPIYLFAWSFLALKAHYGDAGTRWVPRALATLALTVGLVFLNACIAFAGCVVVIGATSV